MLKFVASFYVVALIALCVLGQLASAQCPKMETSGTYTVMDGDVITFSVSVNAGDLRFSPKYDWTVSAGKLKSGQGTSVIKVDTTGSGGQTVTATVEIGGMPASCGNTASVSSDVDEKPKAKKIEEYGDINEEMEMVLFDGFALHLANSPGDQGYVIAYAGKSGKAGESRAAVERARTYLVKNRGVDSSRITTVDGGKREKATRELWIVPAGATPPGQTAPDKKKPAEK